MQFVNLYEAKSRLSALVEQAAAGEEIIIAKNGVARARLVPMAASRTPRQPDSARAPSTSPASVTALSRGTHPLERSGSCTCRHPSLSASTNNNDPAIARLFTGEDP